MKLLTDRNLMLINFAIIFYFCLVYVFYVFKIDFVIIGVFQEMLTIPLMIAQVLFVAIGLNFMMTYQKKTWFMISLMALIVCAILTIRSFF